MNGWKKPFHYRCTWTSVAHSVFLRKLDVESLWRHSGIESSAREGSFALPRTTTWRFRLAPIIIFMGKTLAILVFIFCFSNGVGVVGPCWMGVV